MKRAWRWLVREHPVLLVLTVCFVVGLLFVVLGDVWIMKVSPWLGHHPTVGGGLGLAALIGIGVLVYRWGLYDGKRQC